MDTRIKLVLEEFENNGWKSTLSEEKTGWWIDEVYEIISEWRPVGLKMYLIINIDPASNSNRRKGENVISISISRKIQLDRPLDDQRTIYLSN